MSASTVIEPGIEVVHVVEGAGHLLDVPERRFADMARKAFVLMRRLERHDILAVFAQRAQRHAERFVGFGHGAQDLDEHQLKGEELALQLDFEVLKRLTGLHDLSLHDLGGMSPEDWYVRRFTERWIADFAAAAREEAA